MLTTGPDLLRRRLDAARPNNRCPADLSGAKTAHFFVSAQARATSSLSFKPGPSAAANLSRGADLAAKLSAHKLLKAGPVASPQAPAGSAATNARLRQATLSARRHFRSGEAPAAAAPGRRQQAGPLRTEPISSRSLVQLGRSRQQEHERRQQLASRYSLSSSTSSLSLAAVKRPKPAAAHRCTCSDAAATPTRRQPVKSAPAPQPPRPVREPAKRMAVASNRCRLATGPKSEPFALVPGNARVAAHRSALSSLNGAPQTIAKVSPLAKQQDAHRAFAHAPNVLSPDQNQHRRPAHPQQQQQQTIAHNKPAPKLTNHQPLNFQRRNAPEPVRKSLSIESSRQPQPAAPDLSASVTTNPNQPFDFSPAPVELDDQMVLGSPVAVTPSPSESELDEGDVASDGEIKNESRKDCPPDDCPPAPTADLIGRVSKERLGHIDIPIKQIDSIHDNYHLETRAFARGKFAQVKRCTRKTTNECFAAKCIKKRRRLVDIRHEILLEIEALKLSYVTDRIVKLYEVYETPSEMILILEMADGGELQRVLDDEETLAESHVRRLVAQILEGLIFLHDQDIAHLDIKPQNLLLTDSYPVGSVKLCDFGISRRISKDCEIREICGTPDYVAPEILRYDPIGLATDMWSLGILTYVLLSGYSPFGSENKQQTFCNITQAPLDFPTDIFANTSKEAIDFMQKLIVREPGDRLTSRQARNHPWLLNVKA